MKTAEELFKYYATEPIELTDEYGLDHTQFIKALAEHDKKIKALIDEMIKDRQMKIQSLGSLVEPNEVVDIQIDIWQYQIDELTELRDKI